MDGKFEANMGYIVDHVSAKKPNNLIIILVVDNNCEILIVCVIFI